MESNTNNLSAEELNKMGLAFIQTGQAGEGIKYFDKAIEKDPENIEPYYNKAIVYTIIERYDEAIECYDAIIARDDKQGEACKLKANILLYKKENISEAIELYHKAIYLGEKDEGIFFNLGICADLSGDKEEALKWVERASIVNEKRTDILLKKAELLTDLKKYDEAIDAYDKVLILDSDNEQAYHFKAILLAETRKIDEAFESLDYAESIIGQRGIFSYDRALIFERQTKYEEAISVVEKAIELDRTNIQFIIKKGSLLTMVGNFEGAKNVFDEIAKIEPDNIEGIFHKASIHLALEEYEDAFKIYSDILEKSIDENLFKINSYYFKALCLKKLNREESATEAYRIALMRYSALSLKYAYDPNLMLLKANTLRDLKRFQDADEIYEYIIELKKDMAEAYLMRAKNYIYLGQLDDSKKALQKAIAINPLYTKIAEKDVEFKDILKMSSERSIYEQ